jgi:hypothetical protein
MIELTTSNLLTVVGNAGLIWLVLRLLVKPGLKMRYPTGPNGPTNPSYAAWMNVAAVGIGLIGAVAASIIPGVTYSGILDAILVGLGGAALAVGLNEGVGNILTATRER